MNVTNKKSKMRSRWYDDGGEQVDSPKSKSNKGWVGVYLCVYLCVYEREVPGVSNNNLYKHTSIIHVPFQCWREDPKFTEHN